MNTELQIFNNPEFGEIRTIDVDGRPYFVGRDIAAALGYDQPHKAVERHCRGGTKRTITDSTGRKQMMNVIPEGDLYRLIVNSHLPAAEKFERWVFDEVLPSIRKTGEYQTPKRRQASIGEINSAARIITQTLKEAGMPPQFRAVALQSLYEPVGVHIPLDGLTVDKRTYDATTIARKLGVFSKKGQPHGQAIGAIISMLNIGDEHKVLVPFQNQTSGHSGATTQYDDYAVSAVKLYLDRQGYPPSIEYAGKSYTVHYNN